MRHFDTKAITAKDISECLLAEDDFSLELQVFRACKERGFTASHSGTYEDPVTKKTRQYDIRASKELRYVNGVDNMRVQLAVECKNLRPYFPLVVQRVPRGSNESYHDIVVCAAPNLGSVRIIHHDGLYQANQLVGKATAQVGRLASGDFTTGDAEVFDKWSQAVSSARELIVESARPGNKQFCWTVIIPILVIADGTLWTVDYSHDGTPSEPKQAKECTIYIDKKDYFHLPGLLPFSCRLTHLHIFTFSEFISFLDTMGSAQYLEKLFPAEVRCP